MWIDATGRAHSVALPDPSEAFDGPVAEVVSRMTAQEVERLRDWIDKSQAAVSERAEQREARNQGIIDEAIPKEHRAIISASDGLDEVMRSVERVDFYWRADVLFALDDLL